MKNKVILSMALSLVMLGLTNIVLAEDTAPVATEKASTDTLAAETENTAPKAEVKSAEPVAAKKTMPAPQPFEGVTSLRGSNALNSMALATDPKQLPSDRLPIARNYFQQPPLIPHRVREYKITVNNNKCLSCHSWKNYKKSRATKISQTHFVDRDGNAQSTVAARRYFCNQCHVPQVNAKPLVENMFKPVNELK